MRLRLSPRRPSSKTRQEIEDSSDSCQGDEGYGRARQDLLDSLNASVKAGEAQKGSPKAEDVNKWALWEVSKAKTTVADDISAATKAISSIDAAMGGRILQDSEAGQGCEGRAQQNHHRRGNLYKDSEAKWTDDKTRESLKAAIDTAKKTSE